MSPMMGCGRKLQGFLKQRGYRLSRHDKNFSGTAGNVWRFPPVAFDLGTPELLNKRWPWAKHRILEFSWGPATLGLSTRLKRRADMSCKVLPALPIRKLNPIEA